METVKGQSIDIGMGTNGIKVWEQNVYSGVFLGTYGLSHGGGIIDIGFLFLKSNVKSMQVTNVRMDNGMSLEDLQKASAYVPLLASQRFSNPVLIHRQRHPNIRHKRTNLHKHELLYRHRSYMDL